MTATLSFASIHVTDLDAALAFFTEKLGMVRVAEESTPDFYLLNSPAGGIPFGLERATGGAQPGTVDLGFKVPDADALRGALAEQDVNVSPVETRPFGRHFTLRAIPGSSFDVWSEPGESNAAEA